LAVFPASGRVVPEFENPDLREVLVEGYRVIYRVSQDYGILILTVVHSRRDLLTALKERQSK
jgi:plasmid stabilization system protein ParE